MSQISYRGNLSAKAFPFLTDYQGRTIIVPGPDNTFNRSLTSTEDQDRDVGVPQMFYGHNILPSSYGFSSVSYETLIAAVSPATVAFSSIELIRANAVSASVRGPKFYFAPMPSGVHYALTVGAPVWSAIGTIVPYVDGSLISYATVQGISYIFFAGVGCYKWDSATNTLVAVTLTGLSIPDIVGITAFQGYLIAFSVDSIFWSSVLDIDYTTNSVDFVPSLTTGAGNLRLEGARGDITFAAPATFGVAVYTTSNVVSAVYSGNTRYPFNFREIVNSGGCSSPSLIGYESDSGSQYAYTTSGIQLVTSTATKTTLPELTDFVAGENFEDFDEATLTFSQTVLTTPMVKQLNTIADRYLVFSYGISSLTHAIVYDMVQKRYGKLKVDHAASFQYEYLDPAQADAPRKSIAFLKNTGEIVIIDPSIGLPNSSGVIVLGKFQYVRSRRLVLDDLILQTVDTDQSIAVYDLVSDSGGTLESTETVQLYDVSVSGEKQKNYEASTEGWNHSILVVGGFYLSSFELKFHIGGKK